ncbi:type II toxin-antitoxin system VapC family toxin [Microcoleus sp.]|uniref:type II toxin-antitoxin system VapC family toxin n=1 Tax=Microcoleus sp. TaxID=44472 RepID=UPI003592EBBD
MNVLFDTSVLIAALIEDHPSHSQSLSWLERVRSQEIDGFVSTHTIAELYSVLISNPVASEL